MIMMKGVQKILIDEKQIDADVERLAAQINLDYEGKDLLLVGLLKGSFVFLSDLMKKITLPCSVDFMVVSSYGAATVSSGKVNMKKDLSEDIRGKDVLIVEDIIDSGITLNAVMDILKGREPASLKLCSLLSKPSRRVQEVHIDYLGREIPDEFVIGYGLDYNEKYRNLPYIGIIDPDYI